MAQTQMPLYRGLAAGLNTNRQIEDIAFTYNVVAKTADYTVLATESGTIFTTLGNAADIEFTLPTAATGLNDMFVNYVNYVLLITAGPADTVVAHNNAAADGVSATQDTEQIGCGFKMICDGTYWYALPIFGTEDATLSVVSA
jgi:hypothetical protein